MPDQTIAAARPSAAAHPPISAYALTLLALLTLFWGVNWPIMKIALSEVPVFTFRTVCLGGGAVGLFGIAVWKRMPLGIPRGYGWKLTARSEEHTSELQSLMRI